MKTINFGSAYHENYTIHKNVERKRRYIERHKNEDWTKINPGSLSRFILWNKKSINASIKDFERRFDVKIVTAPEIHLKSMQNYFPNTFYNNGTTTNK